MASKPIRITFCDGEHPHNGSTMHRIADCCAECAVRVPDLSSYKEFDELVIHPLTRKN